MSMKWGKESVDMGDLTKPMIKILSELKDKTKGGIRSQGNSRSHL